MKQKMKIRGNVKIGDELVCPKHDGKVCVVTAFWKDQWGQPAIEYKVGRKYFHSTAFIVFREYARAGSREAEKILAHLYCKKKKISFDLCKKDGSFDLERISRAEVKEFRT